MPANNLVKKPNIPTAWAKSELNQIRIPAKANKNSAIMKNPLLSNIKL